MRTAGPAARAALTLPYILSQSDKVLLSGFFSLYDRHPADPFIAGERGEALPELCEFCI